MKLIRLELKYCEYCGGLLLRVAGDAVIYCVSCAGKLADMPQSEEAAPSPPHARGGPAMPIADPPSEPPSEGVPLVKTGQFDVTQEERAVAPGNPDCNTVDLDAVATPLPTYDAGTDLLPLAVAPGEPQPLSLIVPFPPGTAVPPDRSSAQRGTA